MTSSPIISLKLSDLTHGDIVQQQHFKDQLYAGLKDCGFIILTDHGIDADFLATAYDASAAFFALPQDQKNAYISGVGGQRGYTSFGQEHAKDNPHPDLKEFWHVGQEFAADHDMAHTYAPNVWPDAELPAFRDAFIGLYRHLEHVGHVILAALAPMLDQPSDYFKRIATDGNSILRLLHYPPIPDCADPNCIRAAAHEDINLITLLVAASSSGLELLDRHGDWIPVAGAKNAIIVDAGDMLARITNNHIPATTHRVVNPDGPNISRYSMPFFMHPHPDSMLVCMDKFRDGTEMPDINANAFLQQRLREIGLK